VASQPFGGAVSELVSEPIADRRGKERELRHPTRMVDRNNEFPAGNRPRPGVGGDFGADDLLPAADDVGKDPHAGKALARQVLVERPVQAPRRVVLSRAGPPGPRPPSSPARRRARALTRRTPGAGHPTTAPAARCTTAAARAPVGIGPAVVSTA